MQNLFEQEMLIEETYGAEENCGYVLDDESCGYMLENEYCSYFLEDENEKTGDLTRLGKFLQAAIFLENHRKIIHCYGKALGQQTAPNLQKKLFLQTFHKKIPNTATKPPTT